MRDYEQHNRNWAFILDDACSAEIEKRTSVKGVSSEFAYKRYRAFERALLEAKQMLYAKPALWDACLCPQFIADIYRRDFIVETSLYESVRFKFKDVRAKGLGTSFYAPMPLGHYPADPFVNRPSIVLLTAGGPALAQAVARLPMLSDRLAHFMVGWDENGSFRCVQVCDAAFPVPCVDTPKWLNAQPRDRMYNRAVVVQLCCDPLLGSATYMDSWPRLFTGESVYLPSGATHVEMPLGFARYVAEVVNALTNAFGIAKQVPAWGPLPRVEAFATKQEYCAFYGVCASNHVTPNRTEMLTWWPVIDRELREQYLFSQFQPIYADSSDD